MDFERPNKDNVELGDLLISTGALNLRIFPIVNVDEEGVGGLADYGTGYSHYRDAIILKKDGSYLVGELASSDLERELKKKK